MSCSDIPFDNTGITECREFINTGFRNADEAIAGLFKSAIYMINMRALREDEYKDVRIEVHDTGTQWMQTIFFQDIKRAVITATYGNPIVFQMTPFKPQP